MLTLPFFLSLGITDASRRCAALSSILMTNEQPRTDASSRDRSPNHQYILSIEQTAELYAKAGYPRTIRAIQKYCALDKLDCHKVETETGEKYLVAPYSVERHITYINEVRTAPNSRDQSRTDASVHPLKNKDQLAPLSSTNGPEQPRMVASVHPTEDRYVLLLENENVFLRGQIDVKDVQIRELTERNRETNVLVAGLQKMLSPLLGPQSHREPREHQDHAGHEGNN